MTEPPDDLCGLLGRMPVATPDPDRRDHTLHTTVRTLRRGRQLKGVGLAAGAVMLFVGGGVCGWLVKPTQATVVKSPSSKAEPSPVSTPPPESDPLSAEKLELRAELADDPAEAARLYRTAGDRFLSDRDYENAARCYRRHLSVADAESQKVSASDSWMLTTMKVPPK